MTREEAKELLPIIQAYAEGKTIQFRVGDNKWRDMDKPFFGECPSNYRIKPEPKYRPFKDKEECWNEMLKHQPFGWLIGTLEYQLVSIISDTYIWFSDRVYYTFEEALDTYKFTDGTPFGIMEAR